MCIFGDMVSNYNDEHLPGKDQDENWELEFKFKQGARDVMASEAWQGV